MARSALLYGFKEAAVPVPDSFSEELAPFFKGLKRKVASEKKAGERKSTEGKRELPFELHKWLCTYFVLQGKFFEWAYLTTCWNLMCRSNNVARAKPGWT